MPVDLIKKFKRMGGRKFVEGYALAKPRRFLPLIHGSCLEQELLEY